MSDDTESTTHWHTTTHRCGECGVVHLPPADATTPADDTETQRVEAGVDAADAMNVDGWITVPHPNTGEPMQQQVPLSYIVEAILTAARAVGDNPAAEVTIENGAV